MIALPSGSTSVRTSGSSGRREWLRGRRLVVELEEEVLTEVDYFALALLVLMVEMFVEHLVQLYLLLVVV
jgi:hypothetical protein